MEAHVRLLVHCFRYRTDGPPPPGPSRDEFLLRLFLRTPVHLIERLLPANRDPSVSPPQPPQTTTGPALLAFLFGVSLDRVRRRRLQQHALHGDLVRLLHLACARRPPAAAAAAATAIYVVRLLHRLTLRHLLRLSPPRAASDTQPTDLLGFILHMALHRLRQRQAVLGEQRMWLRQGIDHELVGMLRRMARMMPPDPAPAPLQPLPSPSTLPRTTGRLSWLEDSAIRKLLLIYRLAAVRSKGKVFRCEMIVVWVALEGLRRGLLRLPTWNWNSVSSGRGDVSGGGKFADSTEPTFRIVSNVDEAQIVISEWQEMGKLKPMVDIHPDTPVGIAFSIMECFQIHDAAFLLKGDSIIKLKEKIGELEIHQD